MSGKGFGKADDLESVACARFGGLSQAEVSLLRAAPRGELAVCGPSDPKDAGNDPAHADSWGPEREIRSDLIRWLCVDPETRTRVDPRGIRLQGAKITGDLNLSFACIPFPLELVRCRLTKDLELFSAEIPMLALPGTWVRSVRADGARVRGDVFLSEGFTAEGEVRLLGAEIGGSLDCREGTFKNPAQEGIEGSGTALSADVAHVAGGVFLSQGFTAEGEVRLLGAQIGGSLDCREGTFKNPAQEGIEGSGTALSADQAHVTGGVFLSQGFTAEGAVRLLGAEIRGQVNCEGGTFKNPAQEGIEGSGTALSADQAHVTGGVFLREGFTAEGEVRLLGAEIGGSLDCREGTFKNPAQEGIEGSGTALSADGAHVTGDVFLSQGFTAEGEVRLVGAQISGQLSCDGGTFKNPAQEGIEGSGRALSADGAHVTGDVFLSEGFTAEGEVRLVGAQISGQLSCGGGTFKNPAQEGIEGSGTALSADQAHVAGGVFLSQGFTAEGEVRLLGAETGGQLNCEGGTFKNPAQKGIEGSGTALSADQAHVTGGVFLREGFTAEGEVRLLGAEIGGSLDCREGTFKNPAQEGIEGSGTALSADQAHVTGGVFLSQGFTAEGAVRLLGAEIRGQLGCPGGRFTEVNAQNATIGVLFWRKIKDPGAATLDLRKASVGAIADDEESWPAEGKLFLDGFVYDHIAEGPTDAMTRLKWLARQQDFTLQPYRQLAKVLRETGDRRGAREVLYEMERRGRKEHDRNRLARLRSFILRWTIGYGVRPLWALGWLILLGSIGFLTFYLAYFGGAVVPTDEDAYYYFHKTGTPPPHYARFRALAYSFENSFPLVNLGQKDQWQPASGGAEPVLVPKPRWIEALQNLGARGFYPLRMSAPGFLQCFLYFQIVAGWVLATLFVAGLTGIVRTE